MATSKIGALVEESTAVFNQVTSVWDLVLSSEIRKDSQDNIIMQIQNFTTVMIRVELPNQNPGDNWKDSKNNCVISQPFVDTKTIDAHTKIRSPGEGTLVWDNDKMAVTFHFGKNLILDIIKLAQDQYYHVSFWDKSTGGESGTLRWPIDQSSLYPDKNNREKFSARQGFSATWKMYNLAVGLSYSDDTNTFVLMAVEDEYVADCDEPPTSLLKVEPAE